MRIFYIFYFLYVCAITEEIKEQLKNEDLRMAHHLIKSGWNVTHPSYVFSSTDQGREHDDKNNISKEDLRMIRHLKNQGFTVN